MYVRRKPNKSGSISVQVIDKVRGRSKVIETIGCSFDESEILALEDKGRQFVKEKTGMMQDLFGDSVEDVIETFLSEINNSQVKVVGPELIFGALYDRIGYNSIDNSIFRNLVICRLFNPGSKLRTTDYLQRYLGISCDVDKVYRFLDNLCFRDGKKQGKRQDIKSAVERISYERTLRECGGKIDVVFYDMTTLYWEAAEEDDLWKCGFSKDGKHNCPQIFLGLLVSTGGNPIGYEMFEGNISEGKTLISVIEKLSRKFGFDRPIVIADSGLLSKSNIKSLVDGGYEYILGARPKNETRLMRERILSAGMGFGDVRIFDKEDGSRLIISKTEKRAHKDAYNREKGLKRLEKRLGSGKLTKASINNRGYNKYLKMDGEISVSIDYESFYEDAAWDGIKGYVTNTRLGSDDVIANYGNLWHIERVSHI